MFKISGSKIDPIPLVKSLKNPAAGAMVIFEGWVRNHHRGKKVRCLEYETFDVLAVKEGGRILREAKRKFQVIDLRAVHRKGRLKVGEMAVWVGVSAGHRKAAFAACEYVIDELKIRLPIWKKEFYANGESDWIGFVKKIK